jgi:[protein-PII] uridylyltransferase
MSDVSGALAVLRLTVRSARAWTVDDVAVSRWDVVEDHVDAAILTQRLEAVVSGAVDPLARLRPRAEALPPSVLVRHDASRDATVLEVRADDRPGVVHLVCQALARLDLSVRSAHVSTVGPQALDVFYVQEPGAAGLTDERAASAAHAIRDTLAAPATLDD